MISLVDFFVKNLPTLDLHGETRDVAKYLTKEFINDNYSLKKKKIVVIHGIGGGIVKEAVHNECRESKKVESFQVSPFNSGMTIINLKNIEK